MIPLNDILIRRVSKNDSPKVIDLLQEISVYNPPKKSSKVFGRGIRTNKIFLDIVFFQ
jgi:hypothetical protein